MKNIDTYTMLRDSLNLILAFAVLYNLYSPKKIRKAKSKDKAKEEELKEAKSQASDSLVGASKANTMVLEDIESQLREQNMSSEKQETTFANEGEDFFIDLNEESYDDEVEDAEELAIVLAQEIVVSDMALSVKELQSFQRSLANKSMPISEEVRAVGKKLQGTEFLASLQAHEEEQARLDELLTSELSEPEESAPPPEPSEEEWLKLL